MREGVVAVDMDGTVSDANWRQHLVPEDSAQLQDPLGSWMPFHKASKYDKPIERVAELVRALHDDGYGILFSTARPEWCRDIAEKWLRLNAMLRDRPFDLAMRPDVCLDPAAVLKPRMLADHFCGFDEARKAVKLVIEDTPSVGEALAEQGYSVLLVRGYGPEALPGEGYSLLAGDIPARLERLLAGIAEAETAEQD